MFHEFPFRKLFDSRSFLFLINLHTRYLILLVGGPVYLFVSSPVPAVVEIFSFYMAQVSPYLYLFLFSFSFYVSSLISFTFILVNTRIRIYLCILVYTLSTDRRGIGSGCRAIVFRLPHKGDEGGRAEKKANKRRKKSTTSHPRFIETRKTKTKRKRKEIGREKGGWLVL